MSINKIYKALRKRILELTEKESKEVFSGKVEIDESYFGPKRIRGKIGRGAGKKIVVFGILKRDGKVYTKYRKGFKISNLAYFTWKSA